MIDCLVSQDGFRRLSMRNKSFRKITASAMTNYCDTLECAEQTSLANALCPTCLINKFRSNKCFLIAKNYTLYLFYNDAEWLPVWKGKDTIRGLFAYKTRIFVCTLDEICELIGSRMEKLTTCSVADQISVVEDLVYVLGFPGPSIQVHDLEREGRVIQDLEVKHVVDRCFQANVVKDQIYLLGGLSDEYQHSAHVWVRDYNHWASKRCMHVGRSSFASVVVGHFIYVFGGLSTTYMATKTVEKFDTVRNEWTMCASMPVAAEWQLACRQSENYVYLFGGCCDSTDRNLIMKYCIPSNSWTVLESKFPDFEPSVSVISL
jgi:hypothetical protein